MYLVSHKFKNHLIKKNIIKSTELFSIGTNETFNDYESSLCMVSGSKIKMYYYVSRNGDMVRHINLLNKITSNYDIKIWIEFKNDILFDYGIVNSKNIPRLTFNSEFINLINKKNEQVFMVVEIPNDKLEDWININISIGYIYSDSPMRASLIKTNTNSIIFTKSYKLNELVKLKI